LMIRHLIIHVRKVVQSAEQVEHYTHVTKVSVVNGERIDRYLAF
jgi:hypothetical protein